MFFGEDKLRCDLFCYLFFLLWFCISGPNEKGASVDYRHHFCWSRYQALKKWHLHLAKELGTTPLGQAKQVLEANNSGCSAISTRNTISGLHSHFGSPVIPNQQMKTRKNMCIYIMNKWMIIIKKREIMTACKVGGMYCPSKFAFQKFYVLHTFCDDRIDALRTLRSRFTGDLWEQISTNIEHFLSHRFSLSVSALMQELLVSLSFISSCFGSIVHQHLQCLGLVRCDQPLMMAYDFTVAWVKSKNQQW